VRGIIRAEVRSSVPCDRAEQRASVDRDLYRRLLELGEQEDLRPFLEEALTLVVEATGARQGYLELRGEGLADDDPGWWIAHGFSDDEVEGVREAISTGIVAEALATGRTVETPSALLDQRFQHRKSVRLGHIEAVLCAPIGGDATLGVLYLGGGAENGPFSSEDRARAELFARRVAPFADRLLSRRRTRAEADLTRRARERLHADSVVGRGRAMAQVLEQAALVAPLDVNVLLTGESGTGKSALARVIHENSPRLAGPFVDVNCGALPVELIENELFGSEAGAHATAHRRIPGKVEAAEGGTLLLDEIGDLPLGAQAKLLQLLQSRQYYPLGASRLRRADVRILAATNTDLEEAVRERRFREDLYYRLQVVPIRMPGLDERPEDLADLAYAFLADSCRKHRLPHLAISPGGRRAIETAEWPGHLRQLRHALEAAAIRAAGERVARVETRHVFPDAASHEEAGDETGAPTFQEATRRFQREFLRRALEEAGWNVTRTAQRLDLSRAHLYNLIRSLGIERRES